jgi:Fe2+ transport system protein FeoA
VSPPANAFPLSTSTAGQRVAVTFHSADDAGSARLRDLGVCEGRELRVVRNDQGRIIVAAADGRLGLPRDVASRVFVLEAPPR